MTTQSPQLATLLSPPEMAALSEAIGAAAVSVPRAAPPVGVDSLALAKYLAMTSKPAYPAAASIGFVVGFADGFVAGAGIWLTELKALFRLAGVGTTVGLAEFFARPLIEENPAGLLPQTRQALELLNTMRRLRPVFLWLEEVGPAQAVQALRELIPTADDLVTILGRLAGDVVAAQIRTAPDGFASGEHIGKLTGRVTLEIIRAAVEPMTFSIAALEADDPNEQTP